MTAFHHAPDRVREDCCPGRRFGLKVDPRAKIWQLSVGEQQRVEILKMLYRGAQVLIMDEPTAVLAPQEIDGLFGTLRSMIDEGKSVIFISHKLQEVSAIADRVTVLRRGAVTAGGVPSMGIARQELARLMVGREVVFQVDKVASQPGDVVLDVRSVHAQNDKGLPALRGLSLTVRSGEIVVGERRWERADQPWSYPVCASERGQCFTITSATAARCWYDQAAYIPEDHACRRRAGPDVTDNAS
jgi:simple sugar transport system ATP-binding protein